jgi:hypothetical protein
MRKATRSEHEWPWIQSAARQIFDPESALTLAPKPKRWLKVFDTGTSSTTINPVFHLRHRQTSPGLKRVKTWPVGVGKQINDFLKSLEHLCDEFEIHISEVSLQRTHTLPASRKSARAGIDTLSNAVWYLLLWSLLRRYSWLTHL